MSQPARHWLIATEQSGRGLLRAAEHYKEHGDLESFIRTLESAKTVLEFTIKLAKRDLEAERQRRANNGGN